MQNKNKKVCTYDEGGLMPCEIEALDCEECEWYQEEDEYDEQRRAS